LDDYINFKNTVDWSGRRADSCGISGTGETPQEPWRRGERKAEAPCSAPTSAGGLADEVVL